ncbi:hypothetical protein F5Y16DRAFT_395066 [Xylariaceae sp. FL0255]|nr:hypothetical protein F5Y16DRAFT_395066 [Xylariaceae sp. FL0255]
MATVDLNISNGSCWSGPNVPLSEAYIPCGNVADGGNYTCCHYGDNCLENNACFHGMYYVTYLAGCTVQQFDDPAACGSKGLFANQSWVGLVLCDDANAWAGCPEKNNTIGDDPPTPNCTCSSDTTLFTNGPVLGDIASLPQSLSGTISWFQGHTPTAATSTAVTVSTTASTTAPSSSNLISSSATPKSSISATPTPSAHPPAGLTTGEKAGIGIAVGVISLLVACLIAVYILMRKRKAKRENDIKASEAAAAAKERSSRRDPDPDSPGHLGYKAELPAHEPTSATTEDFIPSPPPPGHRRQYQAYDPRIHQQRAHMSEPVPVSHQDRMQSQGPQISYVSPQTTGRNDASEGQTGSPVIGQAVSVYHELEA